MKTLLIPTFAVLMAAPAFADAEDFGEKMLQLNGSNTTQQTMIVVAKALTGDSVDDRLRLGDAEIVTRNSGTLSAGHRQLARNMGVNAADYSLAELSAMYIGEYD